jgi:hypothetical protein
MVKNTRAPYNKTIARQAACPYSQQANSVRARQLPVGTRTVRQLTEPITHFKPLGVLEKTMNHQSLTLCALPASAARYRVLTAQSHAAYSHAFATVLYRFTLSNATHSA